MSQSSPPRRARSPQAKAARRDQILSAAERLLASGDLETAAMDDVARAAGLAKGTLYLYFRTREELLLGLLERGLDDWLDAVDAALTGGQGWLPASGVADLVVRTLASRPGFRRLLTRLGPVLEYNLDRERALRFKWRVAGRLATTGALLERRTVFLRPGDGVRLLQHLQALACGIQSQAEPAPAVAEVLDAPGLEAFRVDFATEFRSAAGALLTGLERTN